jgi:TnpA family transposase
LSEIAGVLLDTEVKDSQVRATIFNQIERDTLEKHTLASKAWLSGKFSHLFHLVVGRFSYLRQFSPAFIASLELEGKGERSLSLIKAVRVLQELNQNQKRKLPKDIPISFIPKKLLPMVKKQEAIDRQAWECALLVGIRDEIKIGNLTVRGSKRFDNFDHFFMPDAQWKKERGPFFYRSRLPENPKEACEFLTRRLNTAFDTFHALEKDNPYAKVKDGRWVLSVDPGETLTPEEETSLNQLKSWLKKHMRPIKLPQLLIEVDNDLHFTHEFMLPSQQSVRQVDDICAIIASIMAHGCFIGPYTMAKLTETVSYEQIRRITDWQLTEDFQRSALALIVNAITNIDITKHWGMGKTSSSDGQRFSYSRKTLQQTYSTKFRDFALEFYTFVADNYAPYFSLPIECTDRDSSYVLDGVLYNESDLVIEEHYTDTHGYTEINFAAFGMFGKTLSPRIRGVHHQRLYRLDSQKDYGCLSSLVAGKDRLIHREWIEEQWDRMGHFYASLASGHTTASTALKRLTGFSPKNHFYRANREVGRVFKTENIVYSMCDPLLRQNRRRGLLKGEQIHQLARDVAYGKRGRLSARDLLEQKNTCSCLTLIMASIIYWQAKEIKRVIDTYGHELDQSTLTMLAHVSPIGWDNLVLYGEYVIDRNLVR